MLDHFFRHLEIGDDAVSHRANSLDIAGRSPQHHLRVIADGADVLFSAFCEGRNDGRLVEDDAAALDIDQRVSRPQIDGHVAGQYAEYAAEHALFARSFPSRRLLRLATCGTSPVVASPRETVNASVAYLPLLDRGHFEWVAKLATRRKNRRYPPRAFPVGLAVGPPSSAPTRIDLSLQNCRIFDLARRGF